MMTQYQQMCLIAMVLSGTIACAGLAMIVMKVRVKNFITVSMVICGLPLMFASYFMGTGDAKRIEETSIEQGCASIGVKVRTTGFVRIDCVDDRGRVYENPAMKQFSRKD